MAKNNFTYKSNWKKPTKKSRKSHIILAVVFLFLYSLIAIGSIETKNSSNNANKYNNSTTKPESTTIAKSGKDYESQVLNAFWEGASGILGIQYSDFKFTHTACSYIQDFATTDGYTSHYYLIETAYEIENAFGKKIIHPITARCYYVPEYSNDVIVTYMTLDGEKVLFNEEKENWLMGMGNNPIKD